VKLPENRTSLKTIFKAFLFLLTTNILLLKMENIANWITVSIFKLDTTTKLGSAIEFFIFEAPKVLLLLAIIVFIIGIIRTFFTPEKTRKILAGKRAFTGNILASLLGVTTPFCTCSAIPLFIGFITSGVPLGVTFSFLISAPMINEVALILLLGMFGWKVALLYLTTGLFIAIVSGLVIGKLKLERYVEEWVYNNTDTATNNTINITSWQKRIEIGFNNVKEIVGKVWSYLLIGIAIGSFFHGYIPENYLAGIMGKNAFWSVPLAVLIGVPLYSNAAGIIPIVQSLLEKGAALGTVLAFMMSVIGLSLPEMIILRKVLKPKLIATFVFVVATGILVIGYIFNLIF